MIETSSVDFAALQSKHELDVFGKRGITLVRGEGALLYDDQGRTYIDCIAGQGSANLGHAHPRLIEVISAQAARLISCPGAFANDQRALFMEDLSKITPGKNNKIFLCNSGTEAVEAAIKFARIHTGKPTILAAKRGFHGRTFGAMSATHNPKYARGCEPLTPGFRHLAYNRISDLEAAIDDTTAAVILEPIQGEGGVIPAKPGYLESVRRLCDLHGILLILDEIQTGFCRTGRMFACELAKIHPDILCMAKGIAGGFPMGAVAVNEQITVKIGQHGTTFGGNPLACAASRAAIQIMEDENLAGAALKTGDRIVNALGLTKAPCIREIRGIGLMIGIELKTKVRPILDQLADRGILALPAGNTVLRLLPPLVINEEQTDRLIEVLLDVLTRLKPER